MCVYMYIYIYTHILARVSTSGCLLQIQGQGARPIADKYHEGKVKRPLKRELKVSEIAEREANGTLAFCRFSGKDKGGPSKGGFLNNRLFS